MDEVDGIPLNQASRRDLQTLITNAANARDLARPGKQAAPEKVAKAVLDAFKRSHEVRDGQWIPMRVFRLLGGALVARNVSP